MHDQSIKSPEEPANSSCFYFDTKHVNIGHLKIPKWSPDTTTNFAGEAVLLCLPMNLAGRGATTQLKQAYAGFARLLENSRVLFKYIGPVIKTTEALYEGLTRPFVEIESASDISSAYQQSQAAFTKAFELLSKQGIRNLVIICIGYAAVGPFSINRALEMLKAAGKISPLTKAAVCLVHSTYPDTDFIDKRVSEEGWPLSRFYSQAYAAAEHMQTFFMVTSSYNFNIDILNLRAPEAMSGATVIAPPFSIEMVDNLIAAGKNGKSKDLSVLYPKIPGLKLYSPSDLLIPLVTSNIWNRQAIDQWMTAEQYHTCVVGIHNLLRAYYIVAQTLKRRILVPVCNSIVDFIGSLGVPGVSVLDNSTNPIPLHEGQVIVCGHEELGYTEHAYLLGAADLAVSRTGGQANANAILALTNTPVLVVEMPGKGYMQNELTSLLMEYDILADSSGYLHRQTRSQPLGWVSEWSWSKDRLAKIMLQILGSKQEREQRSYAAFKAFINLYNSEEGNFYTRIINMSMQEKIVTNNIG